MLDAPPLEEAVTISERVRRVIRALLVAQLVRNVRRRVPVIGTEAVAAMGAVLGNVSIVADDIAKSIEREVREDAAQVGDVLESAGSKLEDATAKAGRELRLEDRVDDLVDRLRKEVPSERLTSLVASIERGLPTTDKSRYDRAYARGWTRARTTFVGVGLAAGVAAGITGAFLLDPQRGPQRRAALKARARGAGTRVRAVATNAAGEARVRVTESAERARSIAAERGLIPSADEGAIAIPETPAPLVPVMDAAEDLAATADEATEALGEAVDEPAVEPVADTVEAVSDTAEEVREEIREEVAEMIDEGSPVAPNATQ